MKCTIYENIYKFKEPHEISIAKALERIKNGSSKEVIERLRAEPDEKRQDAIKKSLPCLVFTGTFSARRDDAIKEYTNLMILDFDHVEDMGNLRKRLEEFESTCAVWVSPRGEGLKALIKIADGRKHKEHFLAIEKIFHEVDKSGKNISRACFESYDPDIFIRTSKIKPFDKIIVEEIKTEVVKEFTDDNVVYDNLKKWLNNKSEAFASGNRNNYIYKLAGACCRYGLDQYSTLDFILRDFATNEFSQDEIKLSIKSAYRSNKMGVASFDKNKLVESKSQKEIEIEALEEGFEEFSHVIFAQDVRNEADKIYKEGYEKINGINAPVFDYHFKMKRQEISLMTGYGNMGKSTKLLWILLNRAILYGEKFAIYSPESVPAEEFYLELVEMLAGCDCSGWNPNKPEYEVFRMYYDFIAEHFFFVYPEKTLPTITTIKETFLELIIKFRVDGVVIDPFNQIFHDRKNITREDYYLEESLADLTKFAQQNDVYFFIVAHPTANITIESGNMNAPTMYNISGGAMWANKMHNILIYHRPFAITNPDDKAYTFKSEKIKKQKIVGKKGSFQAEYDLQKRRFFLPYFDTSTRSVDFSKMYDPLENNIKKSGKFADKKKLPQIGTLEAFG